MAKTLEQILGLVPLTGLIKAITTGIPQPLPNKFFTTTKKTEGDSGRYTQVTGGRQTARLVMYGAPAVRRNLRDVASKDVKLMHTFEEQALSPLTLQRLRNYEDYNIQNMGIEEVARQGLEFRTLFDNLRIAAVQQTLANGVIYYDGNGNLLPTSSGAVVTVSFGMLAANQNQLNVFGTGNIINFSWKLTNTDIPGQIRQLKKAALKLTGYPLKHVMYGANVPSYITQNDYCLDYLARNPRMNADFVGSGEIPAGFLDLDWHAVYEGFYNDSNDVSQSIWSDDACVFTPEVGADWWEIMEGSYLAPTSINPMTNAEAALGTLRKVYGMGGYGMVTHNPVGVTDFYFDTFLPILKVPNAIFQGVVANF